MSKIGIIMGSDSDLPVMQEAAKFFDQMDLSYEIDLVSAHRTPDKLYEYAKSARFRGLKIIIAGAGGAAHLPGMVAALTSLPVIGVPILTKSLSGLDSLYSIVQMPGGIPVATVAINGALNAAILGAEILGAFDEEVAIKVDAYKADLRNMVSEKSANLSSKGYLDYLKEMHK